MLAVIAMAALVAGSVYMRSADQERIRANARPEVLSLFLNGPSGPKYAGEIVAARSGSFAQQKLSINLVPGGNSDPISSVVNGKYALGVTDSITFLLARANGQPIVAFGAGYLESPTVFYALDSSGIHTPMDFYNKRIGRKGDTHSAIMYDALLRQIGLTRANTKESATNTDLAALVDGKVDVIPGQVGQEAYLLHQQSRAYNVIRLFNYGIHVPGTVYFATEKTLRDYPTTIQHFLDAVIAGWQSVYANPAKAAAVIAGSDDATAMERVTFELAAQRDYVLPLGRRYAEYDSAQWKQLSQILTNARLVDDTLDLSRAVSYGFLKEAYRKSISFGNNPKSGTSPF